MVMTTKKTRGTCRCTCCQTDEVSLSYCIIQCWRIKFMYLQWHTLAEVCEATLHTSLGHGIELGLEDYSTLEDTQTSMPVALTMRTVRLLEKDLFQQSHPAHSMHLHIQGVKGRHQTDVVQALTHDDEKAQKIFCGTICTIKDCKKRSSKLMHDSASEYQTQRLIAPFSHFECHIEKKFMAIHVYY